MSTLVTEMMCQHTEPPAVIITRVAGCEALTLKCGVLCVWGEETGPPGSMPVQSLWTYPTTPGRQQANLAGLFVVSRSYQERQIPPLFG